MSAPTVGTGRMVQVPRNVGGLVYGEQDADGFGTWFFDHYDDLRPEVIEADGGRIFRAEPHPDPKTGGVVIRNLPDETVPLVEYVQLAAQVEELRQHVLQLQEQMRSLAAFMSAFGKVTGEDRPQLLYGGADPD